MLQDEPPRRRLDLRDPELQRLDDSVESLLHSQDILENGARGVRQLVDERDERNAAHAQDSSLL